MLMELNPQRTFFEVKRVGHREGKDGTILVELKKQDMKIKIMKARKCLLNHSRHNSVLPAHGLAWQVYLFDILTLV